MNINKIKKYNINTNYLEKLRVEEIIRLGILKDGVQLITNEIRLPILGEVIPRIEIELFGENFNKKVTVRINQTSSFLYDGSKVYVMLNEKVFEVEAKLCFDENRNQLGMYNFGMMRENGVRSFVFDYHTYCCYSCKFCFKENEWENRLIDGNVGTNYEQNFLNCMEYIDKHPDKFVNDYDIIWLCTGSIPDFVLEMERNCKIASKLREIGYNGDIYVSQVIPKQIVKDSNERKTFLQKLKDSGISRFNSGVEIVDSNIRQEYISGYKGEICFDDYINMFKDAIEIFGYQKVGSCLLAGIESSDNTLRGLEEISKLGVVPAPTVFTPFVIKQLEIPFVLTLDELIFTHIEFNKIIEKYNLPVFSGVFSLA